MTQILVFEKSGPPVTRPLSGCDCWTYPLTLKKWVKGHQVCYLGAKHPLSIFFLQLHLLLMTRVPYLWMTFPLLDHRSLRMRNPQWMGGTQKFNSFVAGPTSGSSPLLEAKISKYTLGCRDEKHKLKSKWIGIKVRTTSTLSLLDPWVLLKGYHSI